VAIDELDSVPENIRFCTMAKETAMQDLKAMSGAATCPRGPIYLERYKYKEHWVEKSISEKRGVTFEYLKDIGVWGKMHRAAKRLCKKKQRPFLWLDKATVHTSAIMKAELDLVWGPECWALQAGKMPDANDGDVGLFPFMKRHLSDLGEHTTLDEIEAGFKSAWSHVTPQVCKAIRARVIRNVSMIRAQKGAASTTSLRPRGIFVSELGVFRRCICGGISRGYLPWPNAGYFIPVVFAKSPWPRPT